MQHKTAACYRIALLIVPHFSPQIWMNINYLALSALQHYGSVPGPHAAAAAALAAELRIAVVDNVAAQYEGSGYLWEQYDDVDGRGMSSHPFTGWTALVALML